MEEDIKDLLNLKGESANLWRKVGTLAHKPAFIPHPELFLAIENNLDSLVLEDPAKGEMVKPGE